MTDHQVELGERLRGIRHQQGLTLQDVEEHSGGVWKAVVVGSYERGDRAISIAKLSRLAAFYGVPLRDLLPVATPTPAGDGQDGVDEIPRIRLDLTHLPSGSADDMLSAIARYARRIQVERGDYNGRILTIRRDDVRAISRAFGTEADLVLERLQEAAALVA